jgi:hypothetical protein
MDRVLKHGQNTDNLHQNAAMTLLGTAASYLFSMRKLVGAVGIEPINFNLSPNDSIGLSSLIPQKWPYKAPILDRNWTEARDLDLWPAGTGHRRNFLQ